MQDLVKIFRFGWPYIRRYWVRLFLGVVLGIIFGFSNAGILAASKALLNRVFPDGEPTSEIAQVEKKPFGVDRFEGVYGKVETLKEWFNEKIDPWVPLDGRPLDWYQTIGLLLLFPFLFTFRGYIGYLSSYCMGWVSERVITDLRQDVFEKLSMLSLDFHNKSRIGDLVTHVHGDTAALHRTLNGGVSDVVKEPVTVVTTVGVMLVIDWQLTLFVLIFLPICVIPMAILGKKAKMASRGNVKTTVLQQGLLLEFLSSIRMVKAFNLEREQTTRYAKHSRELVHHGMKGLQAKEMMNPVIEAIGSIGLGALVLYILWSNKSGSELAIFLAAVATIYKPLKRLAALHIMFQQTSIGVERLFKLLNEKPTVREIEAPRPMQPFAKEIRFENVSFGYNDSLILDNFSLVIPRGMRLGIVGESGTGKSTLINLLFRFYDPQEGRILIDGVDIREVSMSDLRSQMALVSQEVTLFDHTIAENIGCGKPGATRKEIEEAAAAAYAHDFIRQLPQGYDTRVGGQGVLLSGGQRQRIAIARAFIRQAPILALDEATAALDAQSEAEVQKAIDRLAEHRTVLSVAHRLSTLANMDEIIVFGRGGILERGSFEDLVSAGGSFASLASRQGIGGSWSQRANA